MLRLRCCIASHILSAPSTSPISHLRRLLSATAPPIPSNPGFAVEDYLVDTCGLTRPQALKASRRIPQLKSSSKPDAVLAFLAGLGLTSADVAATVAKDPKLLCADVEKTLAPKVVGLTGLGLSRSEIARLVSLAGTHFRCAPIASRLQYYLPFFGSFENFLRPVKRSSYLLGFDLERTVKPNVAFLQECGLGDCDIVKLCAVVPRMLTANPKRVREIVACAEGLGVPCGSGMFREALQAVSLLNEEKITTKLEFLKRMFGWSDAELSHAVSKAPVLLRRPEEALRRRSEFLISEVGLKPAYIAHRPVIISYSMESRLIPRYYVLRFLKANGLLDQNQDYYNTIVLSEMAFVEKFICPHKESAPDLAEDYATICKGEVPTNFRST
ncbi:hypothetical protein ACQ4PT_017813 [Festuca glaucescens]